MFMIDPNHTLINVQLKPDRVGDRVGKRWTRREEVYSPEGFCHVYSIFRTNGGWAFSAQHAQVIWYNGQKN